MARWIDRIQETEREGGRRRRTVAVAFLTLIVAIASSASYADKTPAAFASVNGVELSQERYVQAVEGQARGNFYHGRPPEGEFERFQYEVGQKLIDDELLDQEARRRGISHDEEDVAARLDRLQSRYGDTDQWKESGSEIRSQLRAYLSAQSRIRELEQRIRDVPEPTPQMIEAFYESNREQFTSPEQVHVSMILLRVAPAAETPTWQAAVAEAERLRERVEGGADFGELARIHSQDPSAEEGGDLGYLHRGMLGHSAQKVLDELEPNEVSEPVQLLEGIVLFRLQARTAPELHPIASVIDRATALWKRERQENSRPELVEQLRASAELEILDPNYVELAVQFADAEAPVPSHRKE